jgi:hypothetical protein
MGPAAAVNNDGQGCAIITGSNGQSKICNGSQGIQVSQQLFVSDKVWTIFACFLGYTREFKVHREFKEILDQHSRLIFMVKSTTTFSVPIPIQQLPQRVSTRPSSR